MTPEPLLERDVRQLFRHVAPSWFLERLDTRLGTADVVKLFRQQFQCYGGVGPCDEDGPYWPDDPDAERWAFWFDQQGAKGFDVKVTRGHRRQDDEVIVRQGRVPWNRLANMATLAALELKGPHGLHEPMPGEQLTLI